MILNRYFQLIRSSLRFRARGSAGPRRLAGREASYWEHPPQNGSRQCPGPGWYIFRMETGTTVPQTVSDQAPRIPGMEEDDLTEEMISSARRKNRLNAIVLLLVFALLTFAPQPWVALAPLLLVIPLAYSTAGRMRRGVSSAWRLQPTGGITRLEPYIREPRGPEDPRRYKPIG
jgi:hypothetical protein